MSADLHVERPPLRAYVHPAGHPSGAVLTAKVEACLVHARVLLAARPEGADLAVAPLLRRFLPPEERNAPRLGTLIHHPSLLPRRRGPDAVRWAVNAGDAFTGATWFYAGDGYDDGDIAEQELVAIPAGIRPGDLYRDHLVPAAVRAFVRLLAQLRLGYVRRVPQDAAAATYEGRWQAPKAQGPRLMAQGPALAPLVLPVDADPYDHLNYAPGEPRPLTGALAVFAEMRAAAGAPTKASNGPVGTTSAPPAGTEAHAAPRVPWCAHRSATLDGRTGVISCPDCGAIREDALDTWQHLSTPGPDGWSAP